MALFQSSATILDLAMGAILTDGTTAADFIADQILPPLPVTIPQATVPKILRTNRQIMDIRHAPGTAYAKVRTQIGTATYNCVEAGVEESVSPQDRVVVPDFDVIAGQSLVRTVLRAREAAVAGAIFSSTGETTFAANLVTASTGTAWAANKTSATPLDNVQAAIGKVLKATGVRPDTMLLNWNQYSALCLTTQLLNAYKAVTAYGGGPQAVAAAQVWQNPQAVAQALGLKEIIIAQATYNSANEAATESNGFVWADNYALVFKKAENAAMLNEVAIGRMFIWDQGQQIGSLASGVADTLKGFILETYRNEAIGADVLRAREFLDPKILNASAASLIKGI